MISIVVWLVLVGAVLYVVNTVLPIAQPIRTLINVVVILFVCVWLLEAFGLLPRGLAPPRFR